MNNGKKYLIVGVGILFFLLILISILQSSLKSGGSPAPTGILVPTPVGGGRNGGYQGRESSGSSSSLAELPDVTKEKMKNDLIKKLPIETDSFSIAYSPVMDKIVVTRKTPDADGKLSIWASEQGYNDIISDYSDTLIADQTVQELEQVLTVPTKSLEKQSQEQANILKNLVDSLFSISDQFNTNADNYVKNEKNSATPTPAPAQQSSSASKNEPKGSGGYVYYSQCHGQYDNYPLTSTCTVCRAGCGPTTVSMILSSYVDKKYDPPAVVEIYRGLGAAACGTRLDIAKTVLSSHGVKTSDYIIPYTGERRDVKDVENDLREYINNGWTIFVLATYQLRDGSWGGHYFWMTDISDSGNVMSYDPYYGMDKTPPINENAYYPSPKYLAAFGVKKQ